MRCALCVVDSLKVAWCVCRSDSDMGSIGHDLVMFKCRVLHVQSLE